MSGRRKRRKAGVLSLVAGGVLLLNLVTNMAVVVGSTEFQVRRQDFTKYLTFTGGLEAVERVTVSVPQISRSHSLTISYLALEGNTVKPGDLLVQFDVSEHESTRLEVEKQKEDARIKIAQTEAQLEAQRQDLLLVLATAVKNLKVAELYVGIDPTLIPAEEAERYQFDHSKARIELDKARERLNTLEKGRKAELEVVRLDYQQADLQLRRILSELEKLTIYGGSPGLVTYAGNRERSGKVQIGDSVHRGHPVIYLPNMNTLQVRSYVYDADYPFLRGGEPAEITLDALPGRTFSGRVRQVPEVARPRAFRSVLKAFQVNVLLSEVDTDVMKPGMTARVRVPLTRKDVLVVPREALVAGPKGTTLVRRSELPDELSRVHVIDASDELVVVEGGLSEGERLLSPVSGKPSGVSAATEWLPVEREDLSFTISGAGVLEAERAVDIGPPMLRRIRSFTLVKLAPEGTNVKEGDLLAAFDPTVTLERLSDERADLDKVEEEIERIRASQELEVTDLELQIEDSRVQEEKANNKLVQAREFEAFRKVQEATFEAELAGERVECLQSKFQFVERNAQLQMKILEDRQKLHRYRIEQNERALEALTVTAPISGVVIYATDWRNEKKRVGSDVYYQEKFMSLPDLETMVVQGQVAEVDAGKLVLGQLVNVTLDALPNRSFVGHVDEISSMFTPASRERPVKVLGIKVKLEEIDTGIMRPGMVARLQIVIDRFENVLAVPVSVIQIVDGDSYVWVKNEEGPEMRQVEISQDNGVVAIVESGLVEGEEIAGRASEIE